MAKRKKVEDAGIGLESGGGASANEQRSEMVDGLAGSPPLGEVSSSQSSQAGRESITIRLTDSGSIDISGMREKTTAKLKAAIEATPEIMPGAGELHLDGSSVPDFMVNAVYQLIGGIEQWVFARKYGPEIASIMAYRPQDVAILSDPTKAVLAKYLPKLGKYQEETALVMALASIHIGKVQAMNAALAQQMAREAQRPDVTTINKAPITETAQ